PLLLFALPEDDPRRISTFAVERGEWPPAADAIFVERDALRLMDAHLGDAVVVRTPNGSPRTGRIAGVVHDPGLSPAAQEDSASGYLTAAALASLGESAALDQLKIVVADATDSSAPSADRAAIEQTASRLATWLQARGVQVNQIQIPPPNQHPHQSQMD